MIVGFAIASGTPVDLTTLNATATVNGAIFTQSNFSGSTGTGVFDSFVRYQANGTEQGYNTSGRPVQYDELTSGFTRDLPLNQVPLVSKDGTLYREFRYDINEVSGDTKALLSLDKIRVFISTIPGITSADPADDHFGQTAASTSLVYDLGTDHYIKLNYDLAPGSGNGDMVFLVPNSFFGPDATAACQYNGFDGASCGYYVYLYSYAGDEYTSSDGFEEWSVRKAPYVTVTKTAVPTFTRTFPWTIDKSVTPDSWNLFKGDSGTSDYTVAVTKGTGVDSNWAVSGDIVVTNPSGTDAVINSVADVISGGINAPVTCPVTFPYTLADKGTLTCTYSSALPDGTSRTNTATVTLADSGAFTGTADFAFTTPTALVNDTIHVTDTNGGSWTFSASGSQTYSKTFTCDADAGTHDNTATITETGQSDDASVAVACKALTVTKDAAAALTRTWNWTIDKSVSPDSWNLFKGDSGTSDYTVSVDATPSTSDWVVSGNIHVANAVGNPPATINSITDVLTPAGSATVTGCKVGATLISFPYVLAAGAQIDCTYSKSLSSATDQTDVATATLQNHSFSSTLVATNTGTTNFSSSSVAAHFGDATITDVDEQIAVSDTYEYPGGTTTSLGTANALNDTLPKVFHPASETFTCDADAGTHTNRASFVTNDNGVTGHHDATVTVACKALSVSKDAATSFDRTYHWTITKAAKTAEVGGTALTDLTLAVGEQYQAWYFVTVGLANTPYTDSNWAVSGNIHVANAAGNPPATINSITDVMTPFGAVTVTGCKVGSTGIAFPYVLAAGSTIDCTYSQALTAATDQSNVATATLQNHSFSSTLVATNTGTTDFAGAAASADFSKATITKYDDSITVTDTYPYPGGTVTTLGTATVGVDTLPKTFKYPRWIGPYTTADCGTINIDNRAAFVTNSSSTTGQADYRIVVTVPCPTGCTLTQGYWKTHSSYGPAPFDAAWTLLDALEGSGQPLIWAPDGSYDGADELFFSPNTTATWFDVFWTAPAGNAYYQLAHQYEAAVLNILNDASAPATVTNAITHAEALFEQYTPADIAALRGNQPVRKDFIATAGILGSYNTGTIGPGHCDEDGLSSRSQ
jgi:hypothetical protein